MVCQSYLHKVTFEKKNGHKKNVNKPISTNEVHKMTLFVTY